MFVHDLNQFVTVQPLGETPAVPALGKICKNHGYSDEWVSGQEPRLTKEGKSIICKTDNFAPLVVPGLSANSESIAITGRGGNSSWKQHATCFKFIFRLSIRAKKPNGSRKLARSPENPKQTNKRRMSGKNRTTRWQVFLQHRHCRICLQQVQPKSEVTD